MEKENDYLKERIELLEPIVSHSLDVRRGFVETGKMKYAEGKWVHIEDRGSPDKEIISQRNIACHYGDIDVDFPHWKLSDWGKHTLVRRISKATMVSRLRNMDHFLTLWRISLGCIAYGQLFSGASITLSILTVRRWKRCLIKTLQNAWKFTPL